MMIDRQEKEKRRLETEIGWDFFFLAEVYRDD